MDGINQTKGPFVMFMGHIGVPTKEARLGVIYIFISAFCVAPYRVEIWFLSFVYGCAILR